MPGYYWSRLQQARISRRRALAASAGTALGAVALGVVGCGGDSDSDSQEALGLFSPRVDSIKQAVRGGVLQTVQQAELSNLDHLAAPNPLTAGWASAYVYGRVLKFKTSVIESNKGTIEGDLAESWELSGDKLQLTFKIRPGVKLDPRSPTNGREMNANDVIFSAEKVRALSNNGGDLWHSISDLAPVESMSAPDSRTVVVKLAAPDSLITSLFASGRILSIQPSEAGDKFDPKAMARGWGPYRIKSLESSVGVEYERNPDYYDKSIAFFDGVSSPFVPEYATLISQFRAKNIWWNAPIAQEDILPQKRDFPELLLHQDDFPRNGFRFKFGIKDQNAVTRDERVRQGISMSLDRDLIINTLRNVDEFRAAGIPIETRWHSAVVAAWDDIWLDPRGKDLGPNAKYYQFDIAEAKKLFTAAGYPNGFDLELDFVPNLYGAAYLRFVDVVAGELPNAGIRVQRRSMIRETEWTPTVVRGGGMYTGMAIQNASSQGSSQEHIRTYYHSQAANGKDTPPFKPEPEIDAMIDKIKLEFDDQRRIELMKDFQRVMAKNLRMFWEPGAAPPLLLTWPWVGNAGAYRGYDSFYGLYRETLPYLWYDKSKRSA